MPHPIPFQPSPDWAAKWALYSPDKTAISEHEGGRRLSYGQWQRRAEALAAQWLAEGLRKGERIAVLADFGIEYIVLFGAAQKTGLILVPLNYRLSTAEIAYLLGDAQPARVYAEDKYRHLLPSPATASALAHLPEDGPFSAGLPDPGIRPDDPLFILYTSGTTGFPKGAIYTHQMLFWNSINTAMSLIVNSEGRTINCMPPFHTGGWNVLLTPLLHHGGYTCLMKKFDAAALLHLLQHERPTLFMGVPTMLKMIAEQPGFAQADFSSLHYIIVGGEPMPIPLIEQWHDKGVAIRQGYGMTEVGPNLTSLHQADALRKKGSIGRPNFYVDIRIEDEQGQAAERGELLLRGPMVTPGYWQNPEATAKAFREGWFCTGDVVQRDAEGYLFVVDRIKNMFISGGENVYPAEVERVLLQHPAISEAAVIGVPDAKWGESGKAFIVLHEGAACDADSVLAHCRAHLAKFKVPQQIAFIEALPKNDTGKINRRALAGT